MALIKQINDKIPQFGENCYLAENATIIGDLKCGDNCSFWFNAVVRADVHFIKMGNKVNVQDGAIVHLSSQLGHVSMEGRSVYSMTKFGIEGLTRGMALELAKKNIRVNAVCPTYVQTPLVQKVFKNKKFKKLVLSRIPMGKTAKEIDIASAVCFLASSAASMITGTSLLVDGGWTAQ